MILKPSNVSPNNIAVNAQEQITISWRNLGDRQTKYKIVIYLNLDNTLIYDTGIITTYNTFCVVPANTLINGNTYKYQITVWNANNQSATSDWVIINCSSPPSCALVNIEPEGEILNSSYLFIGEYSQPESVPIKS